jgi:hypothetical protein
VKCTVVCENRIPSLRHTSQPAFVLEVSAMRTKEDAFCESFYPWWRIQTTPNRMTREMASKIVADCRHALQAKLVPVKMPQASFDEHLATAHKVILFSVSWDDAKAKSMEELQQVHQIPKT